jgi:hypothetical protein
MSFIDKIRVLEERYGVQNVRHLPDGGDVVIYLTDSDDGEGIASPYRLTWQQAAYLADHSISNDDLRQHRLPDDWPH